MVRRSAEWAYPEGVLQHSHPDWACARRDHPRELEDREWSDLAIFAQEQAKRSGFERSGDHCNRIQSNGRSEVVREAGGEACLAAVNLPDRVRKSSRGEVCRTSPSDQLSNRY